MKKIDYNKLSLDIFKNIKDIYTDYYEEDTCDIIEDDEYNMLINRDFILTVAKSKEGGYFKTFIFELHFHVNTRPSRVSSVTRFICNLVRPEDIYTGEEFFFDSKLSQIKYGTEAFERFYSSMQESKGNKKCPICERWIPDKEFEDSEYCKFCNKIYLKRVTFH